jgi:hypothetical protein
MNITGILKQNKKSNFAKHLIDSSNSMGPTENTVSILHVS